MIKASVVRLLPENEALDALRRMGDRVSALWNAANYICRQAFFKGERVPNYSALCALMKGASDYEALPTHIGQEVLKKLAKAWTSYFRLRKLHSAGKLVHKPGMPRYRKNRKTGTRPWDYIPVKSTAAYEVKSSTLRIAVPADIHKGRIEIPFRGIIRYTGEHKTCELHYDQVKRRWYAHFVVEVPDREVKERPVRHAAGDLGARRTIAVSIEGSPLSEVFSSREAWKDYKYWSRHIAKEKSRLSTQGYKTSRHLQGLYQKRRLRLRHALEAMASAVVRTLKRHGATHFTVGYPVNCRDDMNFGKVNELVHNFWAFDLTLDILEKHCERAGIAFERTDEAGTSEVCHICGGTVKRPVRSVVVCSVHGKMHADANASCNILKKNTRASAGDGAKAALAWIVMRWNLHLWLSHAESAKHRLLRPAA